MSMGLLESLMSMDHGEVMGGVAMYLYNHPSCTIQAHCFIDNISSNHGTYMVIECLHDESYPKQ